ncbi:MAG: 50S ribosomal protein L5 [Candidatus Dojkabacteria bacterium]
MKLKERFEKEIKQELQKELKLESSMACPTVKKIVVNSGLGDALEDKKLVDLMLEDMAALTGQKPAIARSRKDISNFNRLRKGDVIGVYVTLRGEKMWDFLDKLVSIVLPGVKDFRGVTRKSLDKSGNYSLGFREHSIFNEVDQARLEKAKGIQVTINTSAQDDDAAYMLLKKVGMPFRD